MHGLKNGSIVYTSLCDRDRRQLDFPGSFFLTPDHYLYPRWSGCSLNIDNLHDNIGAMDQESINIISDAIANSPSTLQGVTALYGLIRVNTAKMCHMQRDSIGSNCSNKNKQYKNRSTCFFHFFHISYCSFLVIFLHFYFDQEFWVYKSSFNLIFEMSVATKTKTNHHQFHPIPTA